jgi:hypothetical protein
VTPSSLAEDFNAGRRHTLIAAQLIELTSRLIDATITMFRRLIARLFTKSRARQDQRHLDARKETGRLLRMFGDTILGGAERYAGVRRYAPALLDMIEWYSSPGLHDRCRAGLNNGEAGNKLTRAVFFHERGEIRDGSLESQAFRAPGLILIGQLMRSDTPEAFDIDVMVKSSSKPE